MRAHTLLDHACRGVNWLQGGAPKSLKKDAHDLSTDAGDSLQRASSSSRYDAAVPAAKLSSSFARGTGAGGGGDAEEDKAAAACTLGVCHAGWRRVRARTARAARPHGGMVARVSRTDDQLLSGVTWAAVAHKTACRQAARCAIPVFSVARREPVRLLAAGADTFSGRC